MDQAHIASLESQAYRASYSDGLVDIFIGAGMAVIGGLWAWAPSVAGIAGAIAAVIAWAMVPIRRRVVEPRVGYVTWTLPRVTWERRQSKMLFWMLTASMLIGVGFVQASVLGDVSASDRSLAAGLPAGLLAIGTFVVAATSGIRRLWGYGALLLAGAAVTVAIEAGPGGSLLTGGLAIVAVGIVLLVRFLSAHRPIAQT